jgi:hypothetical protein
LIWRGTEINRPNHCSTILLTQVQLVRLPVLEHWTHCDRELIERKTWNRNR